MTDYTETIKSFIMNEMINQKTEIIHSNSDSLIEQGIVDSLGVQILIAYLEKEFDVSIVDNEIVPENFDTIDSVARLIHSKLIG